PLRLACGSPEHFDRTLKECPGRILGVLAYGAIEPALSLGDFSYAWVKMPVLGADAWYEIWIAPQPVAAKHDGRIIFSSNGSLLFGSLVLSEDGNDKLEATTFAAYSDIFDLLDREGYPELLRVWNYFPGINDTGVELERYREFNMGRHEAFAAKGRIIGEGSVPAACALGTQQGSLVICFLAGKMSGISIENPRQTSAYHYPHNFGPRSPAFSRGMLIDDALFISGTASIVGSQTVHCGDVYRQLEETLENLRAVIKQAHRLGFDTSDPHHLYLNVYLRHVEDYPAVHARLDTEFGAVAHIAYLHADICRADLLVEVEAFWIPNS
ncbi:MAG: hypothetical protein OEV35_04605, partial [Gallionellaceae bacterium]|nr:hypothetical protein [Gallionellaceae bacterium]